MGGDLSGTCQPQHPNDHSLPGAADGTWVTDVFSGSADASRNGSYFAGESLNWRIITDAIERGVPYCDLAGVQLDNPSPKEQSILRYKAKFGGRLTRVPVINVSLRQR